jgi:hypothetical protein
MKRSWRTTLAGLAAILSAVAHILSAPHPIAALADPATLAGISGGIGLIAAQDHGNAE